MWNKLPPSRLLLIFETVVRCGSISRAALDLNMAQPSISQAIKQLEIWVGVTLLDRGQRPAQPTKAGKILYESVRAGFEDILATLDEISWLNDESAHLCTIAAPMGFVTHWLMPHLGTFNSKYPKYPINVLSTHEGAPFLNSRIDIAMRFGNGEWQDGHVDLLFHESIRPVCSPALAQKIHRENIPFEEVTLIHVEYNDSRWTSWDDYLRMTGRRKRGNRNGLNFTNYVQATQATLGGQGLMLGWRSIVHSLVGQGQLIPFLGEEIVTPDSFFLVRKFGNRSQSVDLLTQFLRNMGRQM